MWRKVSGVGSAAVVVQYHVAMLESVSLIACKWDVAKHYTPMSQMATDGC